MFYLESETISTLPLYFEAEYETQKTDNVTFVMHISTSMDYYIVSFDFTNYLSCLTIIGDLILLLHERMKLSSFSLAFLCPVQIMK